MGALPPKGREETKNYPCSTPSLTGRPQSGAESLGNVSTRSVISLHAKVRNMRRVCFAFCVVLSCAWASAGCAGEIRVGGTGSATELLRVLLAEFGKQAEVNGKVVPSLGTTGALHALRDGVLDLAVAARPLKPDEAAKGMVVVLSLRTPFVFATSHPEPNGLSSAELAQAFRSHRSTWKDGQPIRVILRPAFESDTALIGALFPDLAEAMAQARLRMDVPVAATDQDNADLAEQIAGSLVGSTLMQIDLEKRNLRPVAIDGHIPAMAHFESGRYPYTKTLYFVVKAEPSPTVAAFIAYLQSPAGRAVLRAAGVV